MKPEEQEAIVSKFQRYYANKILIYGTGKTAEKILIALQEFHIVGVIDKSRSYGTFKDKPIFLWDDITEDIADVLIIAAARKNYEEIFRRIQDKCIACKLTVLGCAGENLSIYFGNEIDRLNVLQYCKKDPENLKKCILLYDAISFDIFDTLIMRKTLEPWDVFDIVEERLKTKGIYISNFKKNRKEADRLAAGGTIEDIYYILQEILNLDSVQRDTIMDVEIQCERELLIPRYDMIRIMQYAFYLGKKVSLISDMYMPSNLLTSILHGLDIKEFHKLYVSCDYKTSKSDGLFEIYLQDIPQKKCLHIGDDKYADVKKPKQYGIDTYEIKSAYELLKMSEMHNILAYTNNINERNLVGLLIADIFNSPFSLYQTFGILKIDNFKLLGELFFAPLVIEYITELLYYLEAHKQYKGILFVARDGYLFYKLYEKIRKNKYQDLYLPKSFYFLISRKLALRASMQNDDMFRVLKSYLRTKSAEYLLKDIIGLKYLHKKNPTESDIEYINRHRKEIILKSKITQNNYLSYISKEGINKDQKYLLCEMDSQGTTQYALNHLFKIPLDGFYLSKYYSESNYNLPIFTLYEAEKYNPKINMIVLYANFLEVILSSPYPSVKDFNENCDPVFDIETRSQHDIDIMISIQHGIEDFFEKYMNEMYTYGKPIAREIPELIYRLFRKSIFKEECLELKNISLNDNLLNDNYDIWTNEKIVE